jgi:hypothetical protein
MSGVSGETNCPICNEQMDIYSDYKPFDNVNGGCLNCGFRYWTECEQMSLEDVNELRKDYNDNNEPPKNEQLKPLKKADLAKWAKDIKNI